jgi:hypothetical protein
MKSFAHSSKSRLRVVRAGHNIIRSARIPKPVVLADTREKEPLPLFANHPNWIGGERRVALKTGDYTLERMEGLLALERKSLADLVACTVTYRKRFLASCGRLARFRWKAILVQATLEDIKGGFEPFGIPSQVHPNLGMACTSISNCACAVHEALKTLGSGGVHSRPPIFYNPSSCPRILETKPPAPFSPSTNSRIRFLASGPHPACSTAFMVQPKAASTSKPVIS